MRFIASMITLIAFVAIPATSLNLNNGVSTVNFEVGSGSTLIKRAETFNCKGSSLCSNDQDFKNQCSDAYNLIEDTTTYTTGGAGSGVCSDTCGIFVQGKFCSATGQDLRDAYNAIRAFGCEACGSDEDGTGCEVTINYVNGC